MRRLTVLLAIALLASQAAATCHTPPSIALVPNSTAGKAGSIRQYTLFVNNTNQFVWCDNQYHANVTVPRQMRLIEPARYPMLIRANPGNETVAYNLTFSLESNSSDGDYPFAVTVYGKSFEGNAISSSATGKYVVAGRLWDQPDLIITNYGFHCSDRQKIPRANCFLYDSFSLDNVTISNTGNGSFRGQIFFKASIAGPNLSTEFASAQVPPVGALSSVTVSLSKAVTAFSVAGLQVLTGVISTDWATNESSESNNFLILNIPVSEGYPPGCFYLNPPCQSGFACRDNECVPVLEPTPTPAPDIDVPEFPRATPNSTDSTGNNANDTAGVNSSDVIQGLTDLKNLGENTTDIEVILNDSASLQKQGKFAQAKALIAEARRRVTELVDRSRKAQVSVYLYASGGFLILLLAMILFLVIRKRKHEEAAFLRPPESKPKMLLPPLNPENFEKSAGLHPPVEEPAPHPALENHPPIAVPQTSGGNASAEKPGDAAPAKPPGGVVPVPPIKPISLEPQR
ncbi:MAG: hypothetical protein V1708_03400 [Candidatus Micrarchaeota archaeon]